jgi:hypothetical protein
VCNDFVNFRNPFLLLFDTFYSFLLQWAWRVGACLFSLFICLLPSLLACLLALQFILYFCIFHGFLGPGSCRIYKG